jgi:hypothetical protein
MLAPLL